MGMKIGFEKSDGKYHIGWPLKRLELAFQVYSKEY